MPTAQEIQQTQGTRLKSEKPWESYEASFKEKLDPQLEAEIEAYSQKRHQKSSSQNQEEYCRQKEMSDSVAKQYQWVRPEEYADAGARIGRVMTHGEFITILRDKCGIKCWYVQHPHKDKLTLLVLNPVDNEPQVACWVQYGVSPEYSLMSFDRYGVPLAERFRGWRTPTLQLILLGILSEEKANKHFGVASGPASDRFLKTCYGMRNEMKRDV